MKLFGVAGLGCSNVAALKPKPRDSPERSIVPLVLFQYSLFLDTSRRQIPWQILKAWVPSVLTSSCLGSKTPIGHSFL